MLQLAAAALLAITPITQPDSSQLLNDAQLATTLAKIAQSPRARVEIIGYSHQGRPIPMVIVAMPEVLLDLETHFTRATQLAGPAIERTGLGHARLVARDIPTLLEATALPVMFAGASWGNEASAVEGLVAAALQLATEDSDEVQQVLAGSIALIIPLMNPDGRAAAMREWARTPRSNGNTGIANGAGFLLNRDFVHATQPESQAIVRTLLKYRPVIAVDHHEDVYSLGVRLDEVAFVEPFIEGFDIEEHPSSRDAILGAGTAIAARWREAGFRVLFDPQGDNRFAAMPTPGKGINPVASSAGRLNLMASMHGVTSFITESARTPGSQSWEDRVKQKSDAVLATLSAVSSEPERYAKAVYQRRSDRLREIGDRFVVIPTEKASEKGLLRLLELLHLHQIEVYQTSKPMKAFVVPLAQPEGEMAQHLLAPVRSVLNLVPPALGLTALPSESLDEATRKAFGTAKLSPAVPPQATESPANTGSVRVVLYTGQGVAHHDWGEVAWALKQNGIEYLAVDESELVAALKNATALVVPNGSAAEIVTGWDPSGKVVSPPWQAAGPIAGIGETGLVAVRQFVENGGTYVGIGGGAELAGRNHLGISQVAAIPAAPGLGPVQLAVAQPDSPLLSGFNSQRPMTAYFVAPPGGPDHGFVFEADASAVLRYAGAIEFPGEQAFTSTAVLSAERGHAAAIHERFGKGHVVLFGIEPTFRGQWPASARMVINAVILQ